MSINLINATGVAGGVGTAISTLMEKAKNASGLFSQFFSDDPKRDMAGINTDEAASKMSELLNKNFLDEDSLPKRGAQHLYEQVEELRTHAVKGQASDALTDYMEAVKELINKYVETYQKFNDIMTSVVTSYSENDEENKTQVDTAASDIREMAREINVG